MPQLRRRASRGPTRPPDRNVAGAAPLIVVRGGFVHAVGAGWDAHTTANGWEASGKHPPALERIFADARAGRPGKYRADVGAAWYLAPAE
jgi:hypothetical protein